jgi:tetratricopeptide (TPR) repeat protein
MKNSLIASRIVLCLIWAVVCGSLTQFSTTRAATLQDESQAGEAAAQEPVFEGLRQPGDDSLFEIKDESDQLDAGNTDALAWYMAALAAQRRGDLSDAAAAFEKAAEAAPNSAAPLRARALLLFRMGQGAEGLRVARAAIERDPNDFETRLQLAILMTGMQNRPENLRQATQLLDEALSSNRLSRTSKEFVVLHQIRSRLLRITGDTDAAADSYEVIFQALERPEDFGLQLREHQALVRDNQSGYQTTGTVLLEAGRSGKAVEVFRAMCRVEDERPGEHNLLLAEALYREDKLEEAEKNLNLYFETGERSRKSLVLLQDLLAAQERTDELVPRLKELAAESPDATAVRLFTGRVLLDQGDTDAAAEIYRGVLDETGEVDAYEGLIRVAIAERNAGSLIATLNRAGRSRLTLAEIRPLLPGVIVDDQFARQTIEQCIQQYEDKPSSIHPVVTAFVAAVAEQLQDLENEGSLLKATLELNPDRDLLVDSLDRYGMNLLLQEENQLAAATFRQLFSMPGLPGDQRLMALYRLSQAEAFAENYPAALDAIQTALRIAPQVPLLHYQKGWVLAQQGELAEAEESLEKTEQEFRADNQTTERCRMLLAGINAQQREWSQAVKWYQTIIDQPGTDPATLRMCRLGLSNALVQDGNLAEGEAVLVEVYEADPTDPGVNNDLGYLWADQGKNLERAEKMIRIAVDAQPENSAYLDSLGWVLFRLNRNEEALEALIKANSNPDYRDATILEHLGDVYQALGKAEAARQAWQEALQVETDSELSDEEILQRIREKLKPTDSTDKNSDDK